MNGRSTVTNLAVFNNYASAALDSDLQIDVIYTDFSKAFDSVDHNILFRKLEAIGFRDSILSWLRFYLCDRIHKVRFQNALSNAFHASSGVLPVALEPSLIYSFY